MNVYLGKFERKQNFCYKIGITQCRKDRILAERFGDRYGNRYEVFDRIKILETIYISDDNPKAHEDALRVEDYLHKMFPKKFVLEKHFRTGHGTFNGVSGITEMFLTDLTEEDLILTFIATGKLILGREEKEPS